jgi:hypothetical protein
MSAVKSKFAGLLRGFLRRFDDGQNGAQENSRPVNTPPPSDNAATIVSRQPSQPVFNSTNPDEIQLPLQPILAALPMELRAKITGREQRRA